MENNILYSIIVPVYNERNNILPTTESIVNSFSDYRNNFEILFVDDNSPDGTAEEINIVSDTFPEVKLVQHGKKEGIGAAHHIGYKSARGNYIFCLDADLSQPPNDLITMKDKLDTSCDLVIGSRYIQGGEQIGKSGFREIGSKGMNFICRNILGINLTDCTHTFRGFKKELFKDIDSMLDQKGHPNFQIQFCYYAISKNYIIEEIPIKFTERLPEHGDSKLSVRKEMPKFLVFVFQTLVNRITNKY